MIFIILIVAVLLCALVLYLPYSAGLTHIEKNTKKEIPHAELKKPANDDYDGYLPPDEILRREQEEKESHGLKARALALKEKIHVTNDDVPLKIRLNQETVLRRRHEKVSGDTDPNNYDYDLDELIEEETKGAAQKQTQDFYLKESVGGDKEAMV